MFIVLPFLAYRHLKIIACTLWLLGESAISELLITSEKHENHIFIHNYYLVYQVVLSALLKRK
jgi:hypothetical protein